MNMSIDEIKDICVQIAINGVHISQKIKSNHCMMMVFLMMPFCWNGRFFRCSFYTTKKEVDVSALARKANPCGGGHKAAAGFQLSVEDMMGFLKERRM